MPWYRVFGEVPQAEIISFVWRATWVWLTPKLSETNRIFEVQGYSKSYMPGPLS